jgi:nitric oxide reductase activation protein
VKGFDERLGGTTRARLAGLRPEGFTRLGAAVRHSTRLLVDRSGSRRWLLVVLSDGFPFDDGYEGTHAGADVAMALAEARHAGVGALCLGIGTTTPDVELQAVFGTSTYATGPSLSELGADLADLVRAALDGADRSRRITPA